MIKEINFVNKYLKHIAFILLVTFSAFYVHHSWTKEENQQAEYILQTARACEALLPKDEIMKLNAEPEDVNLQQYRDIKHLLKDIARVNNKIKFAYLWIERNGKIYFLADSEPETSEDYSPPGQEYTEAKPEDRKPFKDGQEYITSSLNDRWGTWKSVYVPMKDINTREIVAVLGMDFDASSWKYNVLYSVIESLVLIMLILFLFFIIISVNAKNKSLNFIISEHRKAEIALLNSEQKFRNLVEASSDIIWETDINRRYTYVSPQVEKILGYNSLELIGKTPFEQMPVEEVEIIRKISDNIVKSKRSFNGLINTILHKDGHKVFLETSGIPILDSEGNLHGYRGVDRDITDRKISEDLINEHTKDIEDANISLKKSKEALIKIMEEMENEIRERKLTEELINAKTIELERFNKLMVNREVKMIALKKEINELLVKSGYKEKYKNRMD